MSIILDEKIPSRDELAALYDAVGWSAYSRDPEALERSVRGSFWIISARDDEHRLVGFARIISDGVTIAYLQDILVHPDAQRTRIGTALLDAVIARTAEFRQLVLLTDDDPRQRAFYESLGFVEAHDDGLRSFVRLAN